VQNNDALRVKVDGIEIVYESMGSAGGAPLLLVSGLGDQLISWPHRFCEELVAEGYRVIRFDNRDSGLSTHLDYTPTPNLLALLWTYARGKPMRVPYSLEDMARDAAALLEGLGVNSAHVVGGSLGGAIAEAMAIHHPSRVRTLTLLMAPLSGSWHASPRPRALTVFRSPPLDRAAYIDHVVRVRRALRGTRFPFDEAHVRQHAGALYDRNPHWAGTSRQMAAALGSARRLRRMLPSIGAPTLVIHGSADPLVPVKHGVKTARVIPGAKLLIVNGLGHELPSQAWSQVGSAIAGHAK
jgi:pimeloyl-ACP methyl ester carboxylesterase